jgi:hypothetical protein
MKKLNYCKPETTVVPVSTQPLLVNSNTKALGEGIMQQKTPDDTNPDDPNRSREGMVHFLDDDNEEE